MMEAMVEGLWWIGCALLLVIMSYPLLSFFRSRMGESFAAPAEGALPPVSVILVGFNEAKHARARIAGLLGDPDLVPGSEVIVVTGGATDGMNEELRAFADDPRVRLVIKEHRVPKIAGVNEAVGLARHAILFYCDWRQPIRPGTIGRLVRQVQVPGVGVATARLVDDVGGAALSWTRRAIATVNRWDSRDGGCMNVHGACYAQQRACFMPIPMDILFDDLYVVAATHAQRAAVVQVEDAEIRDVRFDRYYGRERVLRLVRGLLLLLINHRGLIFRMGPRDASRFLLCKYGKLLAPFATLLLLPKALVFLLTNWAALSWTWLLPLALVLVPRARRWLATMVRFNWYILVGVVRFFMFADRSNRWEKLSV